ncbi:conserved hypothetical protein [Nocardioides sp. AX2bis]|nr:conserved hypothetical protein [Nocardioides sp. AX2bis]
MMNRFSFGPNTALQQEVLAAGGGVAWFNQQVATAYDRDRAAEIGDWWPLLHQDPLTLWRNFQNGGARGIDVTQAFASRELVRRVQSPSQVLEVMTEFWQNHLHVPAVGDRMFMWRVPYGDLIRRCALGRYDELLPQAVLHPAMLIYLDGGISTRTHPNENLGRELLELHTVGRGNYTEDDVKNSARILTGHRIDVSRTWAPSYRTTDHWTGPVRVMDFSHANTNPDGRAVTAAYLRYLARHPATARRICRLLATWFVSDQPSQALIDQLAAVYLANNTAVAPVLRALIASEEFRSSTLAKLRDPSHDVVATHRVLGTQISAPTTKTSAAIVLRQQAEQVGMGPYAWSTPDGAPITGDSWASPARALASMRVHWALAGGYNPTADIRYRTPQEWVPQLPMTFRQVVDSMSLAVLNEPTPAGLLQAATTATGVRADETITSGHVLITTRWNRLLGLLLDHPHRYRH